MREVSASVIDPTCGSGGPPLRRGGALARTRTKLSIKPDSCESREEASEKTQRATLLAGRLRVGQNQMRERGRSEDAHYGSASAGGSQEAGTDGNLKTRRQLAAGGSVGVHPGGGGMGICKSRPLQGQEGKSETPNSISSSIPEDP